MSQTWALVDTKMGNSLNNTTRYNYPAQEIAPSGTVWSFYLYLVVSKSVRFTFPPLTEYSYGTAKGYAKQDSDGNIQIDILGTNPEDIVIVAEELKKVIGCVKLNPALTLPNNIKGRWAKIMHIWNWFNQNN